MVSDQKDQDEDEYILDVALEVMEKKNPPDYSANDIIAALNTPNNKQNFIDTQQLKVLDSFILSKDYDIQQTDWQEFLNVQYLQIIKQVHRRVAKK